MNGHGHLVKTAILTTYSWFILAHSTSKREISVEWFRSQVTSLILPPYRNAAETFHHKIVQPIIGLEPLLTNSSISLLADATVNASSNHCEQNCLTVRQTFENVTKSTKEMQELLKSALAGSEKTSAQVTNEVNSKVAEVSAKEAQLQQLNNQLKELELQLDGINKQLADAQNQVNSAQAGVGNEEANANEGERRVKQNHNHCTGIGGWLGKRICEIFNHDGIKHAKQGLERARTALTTSQNRLTDLQNNHLNPAVAKRNQLLEDQNQRQASLTAEQQGLDKLREQLSFASTLNVKLRDTILHVDKLLAGAQVLEKALVLVIDLEPLIVPMKAVADEFVRNKFDQVPAITNADTATLLRLMPMLRDLKNKATFRR